jgi:hypothetical protein
MELCGPLNQLSDDEAASNVLTFERLCHRPIMPISINSVRALLTSGMMDDTIVLCRRLKQIRKKLLQSCVAAMSVVSNVHDSMHGKQQNSSTVADVLLANIHASQLMKVAKRPLLLEEIWTLQPFITHAGALSSALLNSLSDFIRSNEISITDNAYLTRLRNCVEDFGFANAGFFALKEAGLGPNAFLSAYTSIDATMKSLQIFSNFSVASNEEASLKIAMYLQSEKNPVLAEKDDVNAKSILVWYGAGLLDIVETIVLGSNISNMNNTIIGSMAAVTLTTVSQVPSTPQSQIQTNTSPSSCAAISPTVLFDERTNSSSSSSKQKNIETATNNSIVDSSIKVSVSSPNSSPPTLNIATPKPSINTQVAQALFQKEKLSTFEAAKSPLAVTSPSKKDEEIASSLNTSQSPHIAKGKNSYSERDHTVNASTSPISSPIAKPVWGRSSTSSSTSVQTPSPPSKDFSQIQAEQFVASAQAKTNIAVHAGGTGGVRGWGTTLASKNSVPFALGDVIAAEKAASATAQAQTWNKSTTTKLPSSYSNATIKTLNSPMTTNSKKK